MAASYDESSGATGTPQSPTVHPPSPTGTRLEIRNLRSDGSVIIQVRGEIDLATVPMLAEAIDSIEGATRRVVVDLSAVSFLDSSGLNALLRSQRDLAEWEIDFRLVCPADGPARRSLEITNLIERLSVIDTLDAALA